MPKVVASLLSAEPTFSMIAVSLSPATSASIEIWPLVATLPSLALSSV